MSLTTSCLCLQLKPLPSVGVTRLQRYSEPLRHPTAPSLSLAGVRLIIPHHALGLPVLPALSLCACCRHYPGAATGGIASLIHPVVSAFPERVVGSACASAFSRLAQRSLALRPAHSRCHQFVARLPEGFSHFVTFMTAPVASGWSGCRMGLAPTGKAPPYHGAHPKLPVMLRKSRLPTFEVSGREKGAACWLSARPKGYARWRLSSSLALRKSGDL